MHVIRQCRDDETSTILAIVNAAAEAYRDVIPADRWHDPYMSAPACVCETRNQRLGVGAALITHLRSLSTRRLLVGTWADATWAIRFYQREGFVLVPPSRTAMLLKSYWDIPERQIETSVVLERS